MAIATVKKTHVRPFREDDVPQIADIHRRVFQLAPQTSPELVAAYRVWLSRTFLSNPWRQETLSPLVYEDDSGKVGGFLGVLPRKMIWNGKTIQVAIMSNFVVDPDARGLAGMKLLRAFLAGPQDLSVTDEANADVRRLWEGLGGATALPYSMHWYYPLRPARFAAFAVKQKSLVSPLLAQLSLPAARVADAIVTNLVKFPFRNRKTQLAAQELDAETWLASMSRLTGKLALRPYYDLNSLEWILQRAQSLQTNGNLRKVILKNEKREVVGWYVYYVNPKGLSQVVQIHAVHPFTGNVVDHLLRDAWQSGVVALSGRPEPGLLQALSERHFILGCGPEWALVHSPKAELADAFHRSDIFFSRLDGEWCTHFR